MHYYENRKNLKSEETKQLAGRISGSVMASHLGIKNWHHKIKSCSKIFNNNDCFGYDKEAVYLIDKLEITLISGSKEKLFDPIKKNRFIRISKDLLIVPETGKEKQYYHDLIIYLNDIKFGTFHVKQTRNKKSHKICINNETLHCLSKFQILDVLYRIAEFFDLCYSNVHKFELARDSKTNYYERFCHIYANSNLLMKQVHQEHKSEVRYLTYGKPIAIDINGIASKSGKRQPFTFTLGKQKSDTQIKIYEKLQELKKWQEEKSYISEIHKKHFDDCDSVSRVEVMCGSVAVNKRQLDLLDLLNPQNHPRIFQSLLGDKLKFHDTTKKYYSKSRNKKYKTIELINPIWFECTLTKSLKVQTHKSSHRNNYNKFRNIVHMYLDGEHDFNGVKSFFKCNIWNMPISRTKYHNELIKAVDNHQGVLFKKQKQKVKVLFDLLNCDGNWLDVSRIKLYSLLM